MKIENLMIYFIYPTITAVFGGVIVWFITKWIASKNIFGDKLDCRRYQGRWHGIHATKHPQTGVPIFSRHEYDLRISRSGGIKGKLIDKATTPHRELDVRGFVFPNGMSLIEKEVDSGFYTTELYTDSMCNPDKMIGILSGHNYHDRKHIAAIILISRHEATEDEFMKSLEQVKRPKFYSDLASVES